MELSQLLRALTDTDAIETQEWLDALASVVAQSGPDRAAFLLSQMQTYAQTHGLPWQPHRNTPYVNTIGVAQEPPYPGGAEAQALEERIASITRWNALAMVVRANRYSGDLGGHIARSERIVIRGISVAILRVSRLRRICLRLGLIISFVPQKMVSVVISSSFSRTLRQESMPERISKVG